MHHAKPKSQHITRATRCNTTSAGAQRRTHSVNRSALQAQASRGTRDRVGKRRGCVVPLHRATRHHQRTQRRRMLRNHKASTGSVRGTYELSARCAACVACCASWYGMIVSSAMCCRSFDRSRAGAHRLGSLGWQHSSHPQGVCRTTLSTPPHPQLVRRPLPSLAWPGLAWLGTPTLVSHADALMLR